MQKINCLVTGGAGYLGVHLIKEILKKKKYKIIVIDNLSSGSLKALRKLQKKFYNKITFLKINICNFKKIEKIFKSYPIHYVFHLAAKIDAKESFKKKKLFYIVNYVATKNIVKLCNQFKVKKIIFSSSAAVYGNVNKNICFENQKLFPGNPYGRTKMLAENAIKKLIYPTKFYILRLFNLAGINKEFADCFENRSSIFFKLANHLFFKRKKFAIYQSKKFTRDLSTERDFIHVTNVARLLSETLNMSENNFVVNVGTGKGTTIIEFIKKLQKIIKVNLQIEIRKKRKGDPVSVLASTKLMKQLFQKTRLIKNEKMYNDCYDIANRK